MEADKTDELPYTSTYVCSDFAKALHENSETAGIKAGWVGAIGVNHAFNVFETTDKGNMYVDFKGVPEVSLLQDKQLDVVIGQPLSESICSDRGRLMAWGELLKVYWFIGKIPFLFLFFGSLRYLQPYVFGY